MTQNFLQTAKQFKNFAIVGLISTAVNYGIFYVLLNNFVLQYLLASAIGFGVGIFVSFGLNRKMTFEGKEGKAFYELVLYILMCLVSLAISLVVLRICVEYFNMSPLLGNLFAIGCSTVCNFLGAKLLVFRVQGNKTIRT